MIVQKENIVRGVKIKTATELIREKLSDIGADGLCDTLYGCGCKIDWFAPCKSINERCVPAKNNPQKATEMECGFWMEQMED